jgi:hemolysin activation/secretion protein
VRKGLSGLGASELGTVTSSRFQGNPEFTTVRASGSARWTFGGRPVGIVDPGGPWVEMRAVAQWADGPLLAFEEYQIGNYSIGRGFDPGSASGDNAYGAQFEVGWPILKGKLGPSSLAEATYMEPYAFYDIARVENEDLLGYTADISSAGIGFRMRLPFTVVLDFAIAQPLTEPFPGAEKPDLRFMGLISVPFTLPFL